MKKTIAFEKQNYIQTEPIIIYGASVYGELAYIALKQLELTPKYFCDKSQARKEYLGIKVIQPETLKEFQNANIIIASADFFGEIQEQLQNMNCNNLYDMRELLKFDLAREVLSNRALEMYTNKQHYIDIVNNQGSEKIVFNRIQFVVTEKCSLRCKDCSHLIPYYKEPENVDLEKYKEAFDLLLEHTDYVAELRILGGEPFLHKEMGTLIDWYHDNPKIESISIYTNGTIVPSEAELIKLKNKKVKVHISNYGINEERLKKLVQVFDEKKICYFVRKYDSWQDSGDVEFRDYTLEKREQIFANCFERNGYTFLKGKLYRCPRAAHAINLKAMPDRKEDYIDLLKWRGTPEKLVDEIKALQGKTYLEACNYCGGPDNHIQSIPAAIQTTKPIPYEIKH